MDTRTALEQLLATLTAEEAQIAELLQLGLRERDALVNSDYEELNAVTVAMLEAASRLDQCEAQRASLLTSLGRDGAGLDEIAAFAAQFDFDGFSKKGADLRARILALHEVQEQNAQLLLSAARLRERWVTMLTRLSSASYGPDGDSGSYRLLSRSA